MRRFDPPYHFFLTIVSIANIVIAVIYCVHHLCFYSVWLVVLVAGGVGCAFSGAAVSAEGAGPRDPA